MKQINEQFIRDHQAAIDADNAYNQSSSYDPSNPTPNQDTLWSKYDNIIMGRDKNNAWVKAMITADAPLYKNNTYKGVNSDHNIIVNLNNLTDTQKLEINKYALGLINDVNRQLGRPEFVLSDGSMKVAQAVADQYTEDRWSGQQKGHDYAALNPNSKADQLYGIKSISENMSDDFAGLVSSGDTLSPEGGQYIVDSPDSAKYNLDDDHVTMYDLKGDIYNGIRAMLFENVEWGHATNFASIATANQDEFSRGGYNMGVAISRVSPDSNEYDIHYNIFTNDDADLAGSKFSFGTKYEINNTAAITNAESKLTQATNELTAAKTAQKAAQDAFDAATAALTNAQNALSNAKQTADNKAAALTAATNAVNAAQTKLDQANAKLADAQAAQTSAERALAAYQMSNADKLNAVNAAKTVLDAAKTDLANAQNTLNTKKNVLANAQAAAKTAQDKLAKANQDLAAAKTAEATAEKRVQDLVNAPERLAEAVTALNHANAKLANAKAVQAQAATVLTKANQDLANAQDNFDKAEAAKDKADEALAEFNDKQDGLNYNYFNRILDNVDANAAIVGGEMPVTESTHEATETHTVPATTPAVTAATSAKSTDEDTAVSKPVKPIKTVSLSLKKNKLTLNNKRVTLKQVKRMLAKKYSIKIRGSYKKFAKRVRVYTIHGKHLAKKLNFTRARKFYGIKTIKGTVMLEVANNRYVKFTDLF